MDGVAEGLVVRGLLGLAPVACFLAVLVLLDSYKLVRLRTVAAVVVAGAAAASLSYVVADGLLRMAPMEATNYKR